MQATPVDSNESYSVKNARIERSKKDYAYFFKYYLPMYATSECGWFHIFIASLLIKFTIIRLLLKWFRGGAKSVHSNIGYPLWLKINEQMKFMVLVGQNETKACILLSDIQAQLMSNKRFINDFGEQFSHGSWEEGNFKTKDGCAFFALGFGQSPRGLRNESVRPDYISLDDVDTQEMSNNPSRVRKGTDWVCDDLMGCFDVGKQRLVVSNNTPFVNSIIGTLSDDKLKTVEPTPIEKIKRGVKAKGAFEYKNKNYWHSLRVNAVDEFFNPAWEEKYTREYWLAMRDDKSLRSWMREYMNTPVVEGSVFKNEWIQWKPALPLHQYDLLLYYSEPSYTNTAKSDFKAGALIGKKGKEYHIINAFVRRTSIGNMVKYQYDLWLDKRKGYRNSEVVINFWMEASFMQYLLLDEFTLEGEQRKCQLPIRGDKRQKPDKYQRIENISPLFERGFIFFNSDEKESADMQRGIEQLLAFGEGSKSNDDFPDILEGGLHILNRQDSARNFTPVVGYYTRDNAY